MLLLCPPPTSLCECHTSSSPIRAPVRLLLIKLVDGKVPALFEKAFRDRHIEIAMAMVDLNVGLEKSLGIHICDMLVHLHCSQFNNEGRMNSRGKKMNLG